LQIACCKYGIRAQPKTELKLDAFDEDIKVEKEEEKRALKMKPSNEPNDRAGFWPCDWQSSYCKLHI